ncbi:MAG: nuclear transport factor 2 family protein, partial [Thermoanaerobaculia bacterium]|nr:nuclear transport factor 2 family protein [Thermoanaerobaculia bacterium]
TIDTTAILPVTERSSATPEPPSSPWEVAESFLDRLRRREITSLGEILAADVWLRALLPGDTREERGAAAVVATFRGWFERAAEITLVHSQHHSLGTRELVGYRYRVRKQAGDSDLYLVEQTGYCRVKDGRIRRLDVVCTGYHRVEPADT